MKNSALLLLLISFSFASPFFISSSGGPYTHVYNAHLEEVPPPLRFLFSGEKANVHISGLEKYYVTFGNKGEILEFGEGSHEDPSLELSLNKHTLSRINSGQLNLDDAVRTKQLVLKTNTLACSAKLQIALGFINTAGIWNDIFAPGIDRLFSFLPF